jgi:hypothetical protein
MQCRETWQQATSSLHYVHDRGQAAATAYTSYLPPAPPLLLLLLLLMLLMQELRCSLAQTASARSEQKRNTKNTKNRQVFRVPGVPKYKNSTFEIQQIIAQAQAALCFPYVCCIMFVFWELREPCKSGWGYVWCIFWCATSCLHYIHDRKQAAATAYTSYLPAVPPLLLLLLLRLLLMLMLGGGRATETHAMP